jgi:hypothetical protein
VFGDDDTRTVNARHIVQDGIDRLIEMRPATADALQAHDAAIAAASAASKKK